jgi:hypothetical protein
MIIAMKQMLKQAIILGLSLLFILGISSSVFAAPYGSGKYSSGKYGVGTDTAVTGNNGTPKPSTPVCTTLPPGDKSPWLYAAVPKDGNSILLYFTEASDPVDHYVLEFGTKSGEYPYGSTDIGGKGTRTYLVSYLLPNTKYYFRIRGGNGCATGGWSNEISAKTKGILAFNQLSTDSLVLVPQGNDNAEMSALDVATEEGVLVEDDEATTSGYIINLKVIDKEEAPVAGAKVTLHSVVQETTTDENGNARFENVEPGEHRVIIAYNDYEGEQSINITGEQEEFQVTIVVEQKDVLISPLALALLGGMSVVIIILIVMLIKSRKTH